jgi:hypothetical protein
MTTTPPTDIIARYLTVAGVALSNPALHVEIDNDGQVRTAACTGCTHKQRFSGSHLREHYSDEYVAAATEEEARSWAQSHAQICRAMPAPTN